MSEKIIKKSIIPTLFIILLCVLLFLSIATPVHRWGDASTYYMQISSIVEDHDLEYRPIDLQRALQTNFDDLPSGIFLIRTAPDTYFFGKEFSFALLAAPFFVFFGIQGILIFNALMFWCMILMGFLYLRKQGNSGIVSFSSSVLFFILSTAFVYIFWLHSDIYNMFLLMLGLFLWANYYESPGNEKFLFCAAFIFGLATVSRIPNGLVFLPFLLYEMYSRRFERVISLLILFLIPLLLFYGYFYTVTGETSFYGGDQSYFISDYPFTNSSTHEIGQTISFTVKPGKHEMTMGNGLITTITNKLNFINYSLAFNNAFYYFFGRFTGIIWYYPLAVFALVSTVFLGVKSQLREQTNDNQFVGPMRSPTHYLILIGIFFNILFFLILNGSNYFGGQHAVGNRYFWVYPAFLFLIGRINLKLIIPFVLIALITVVPIISDPVTNSQSPQSHTFALPYPWFPLEYYQVRNLPLWFPQQALQNFSLLYTDSEGEAVPIYRGSNTYSITGTSHWIVQKKRPIDNVTMMFTTTRKEEGNVSVLYGSYSEELTVNNKNPVTVIIPLKQREYYYNQKNELSVRSVSEINMHVLNNGTDRPDIVYSEGWFDQEKNTEWGSYRWMTNHSTLVIDSDIEQNKSLRFEGMSFYTIRNFTISGEGYYQEYQLNPETYMSINSSIHVNVGYTTFQFNVLDGCASPSDSIGLNKGDTRCISINVRNMTVS